MPRASRTLWPRSQQWKKGEGVEQRVPRTEAIRSVQPPDTCTSACSSSTRPCSSGLTPRWQKYRPVHEGIPRQRTPKSTLQSDAAGRQRQRCPGSLELTVRVHRCGLSGLIDSFPWSSAWGSARVTGSDAPKGFPRAEASGIHAPRGIQRSTKNGTPLKCMADKTYQNHLP